MDRRKFLKTIGALIGGGVVIYTVIQYRTILGLIKRIKIPIYKDPIMYVNDKVAKNEIVIIGEAHMGIATLNLKRAIVSECLRKNNIGSAFVEIPIDFQNLIDEWFYRKGKFPEKLYKILVARARVNVEWLMFLQYLQEKKVRPICIDLPYTEMEGDFMSKRDSYMAETIIAHLKSRKYPRIVVFCGAFHAIQGIFTSKERFGMTFARLLKDKYNIDPFTIYVEESDMKISNILVLHLGMDF